jgi:TfoX/Sxy family transcriptional regulator of competence genes
MNDQATGFHLEHAALFASLSVMAYDQATTDRVTDMLTALRISFTTKAMFGGLCFMVNDKMCVGVLQEKLMVRLDPEVQANALAQPGCLPMDFTGKPMKGYVFVGTDYLDSEATLRYWVNLALEFNPKAKASKKR